MKTISCSGATAVVELSSTEIHIMNNALNEVCNGIDLKGEFDTRMGCSVEEAKKLLNSVHQLGMGME